MTAPSAALTLRHRKCSKCGKVKPWFAFYAASRWPDSSMRRPRPDCKVCARRRVAAYYRSHARRIIESHSLRWRTDSECRRRHYERRRAQPASGFGRMLDAAPFAKFILDHFGSLGSAAEATGLDARQIARYLDGTHAPTEATVDRVLCHLDNGTRLQDLYPELED